MEPRLIIPLSPRLEREREWGAGGGERAMGGWGGRKEGGWVGGGWWVVRFI